MIDHARHIEELRRRIVETRRDRMVTLREGRCPDYATYQHTVGWIQALEYVLGESEDLAKPEEPKQAEDADNGWHE